MPDLVSKHIASADYDEEELKLTLTFRDGGVYEYNGVPLHIYTGLLGAASPSQWFRTYIKGTYEHARVG